LLLRLDPKTGLISWMESKRYRDARSGKIRWQNKPVVRGQLNGQPSLLTRAATWMDQGALWAVFAAAEIVLNAGVLAHVRARGS
jgi:hypothetical protein